MKHFVYILFIVFMFSACEKKIPLTAKKETFHVAGNCGMCKKTIEKSLDVKGIIDADWNKKTKLITVLYDTLLISMSDIKQKIANAGYDNDGFTAKDEAYNKLHACCKYDREK